MEISRSDWDNYIRKLSELNKKAAQKMREWVEKNGLDDREALIRYAQALVTKYGEGSAELACQMYDAIAEMENVIVPSAIPALTASYGETARAINGSFLQSPSGQLLFSTIERLVKQPSADTMLKNAKRDRAQFAWITNGDTCAFCIALSSRGWQYMSNSAIKGNHATHIHANCDCNYAIRLKADTNVSGYDPKELYDKYASYGGNSKTKINAMRREAYEKNKDSINAQKREAYAIRKEQDDKV